MKILKRLLFVIFLVIAMSILISIVATLYVLYPYGNTHADFTNEVQISTFDGITLKAEIKEQDFSTHKWAIMVHSYRTNHLFMEKYGEEYYNQGYNILLPDNRAHGSSEGIFIGMGYLDQYDILEWVNYVISIDPGAQIVLHGVSMGASTIMMLSGQKNLPDNIKVLIEDCGYTSATDYLTWKLRQRFYLPSFPVIPLANLGFKVIAGYYMNDASAIEAVAECEIPMMFIHGTDDTTVSVENVYDLYDAATCDKELYIVEEAGHGQSLNTDPDEYWSRVFRFIGQYIG